MMLGWMLSALLFGGCVALVAAAMQPFARAMRWPTRWIWALALAVATLWPVVSTIGLLLVPSLRETVTTLSSIRVVPDRALGLAAGDDAMQLVGRVAIGLWALASIVLSARLVRALVTLRRLRRAAEPRVVDGIDVLVSDDLGPATIGLRRHAVVVPRAVLDLETPLRRLLLRHECEHRLARDPWLSLAASLAVVLFPWNVALWAIAYRLRLAVEIDCDARVLAGGGDAVRYGRLLLLFAQRRTVVPLALTLGAPQSQLERRIIAMRTRFVRPRPLQLAVAAALLLLGLGGACSAGAPDAPSAAGAAAAPRKSESPAPSSPPNAESPAPSAVPNSGSPSSAANGFYEFQVDQPARELRGTGRLRYPREMRLANREGKVLAQFVVGPNGTVDTSTFKVLESTDRAFTEAVHAALPTLRFAPAIVKGRAVRQVVQQPFTFSLSPN